MGSFSVGNYPWKLWYFLDLSGELMGNDMENLGESFLGSFLWEIVWKKLLGMTW